ncbi:MAG: hypothetical protein IJ043_05575 [Clostridia bacterium]|nr:hypothetical protein [Clostridia bacterium]
MSMKTDMVQELRELQELSRELNTRIDRLLAWAETESGEKKHLGEMVFPLTRQAKIFKGKKAVAVLFSDGRRVDVLTWKQVAEVILKDCNKKYHAELMELRGRIGGRNRVLLSACEEGMRCPRVIDQELYFETHYDVESMLQLMVDYILHPVGYNYRGVSIIVQEKK